MVISIELRADKLCTEHNLMPPADQCHVVSVRPGICVEVGRGARTAVSAEIVTDGYPQEIRIRRKDLCAYVFWTKSLRRRTTIIPTAIKREMRRIQRRRSEEHTSELQSR